MSKPNVLILGGVGFIGRNIAVYLIENDLVGKVRAVDKVLPKTAYLTEQQQKVFEKVEFKQGNLVSPASIEKCFALEDGGTWDVVINAAAETKYSQTDAVYEEKVMTLSVNCAKHAKELGVGLFVEISTGQVYDGDKKASTETSKTKPWTSIAKFKLLGEEAISAMDGLNYIILRPAVVYGPSDLMGITPRLIVGAVYKQLAEKMTLMWGEKLRINTVHVEDLARAIWHLKEKGVKGEIFNVVDDGDSSQDTISDIVSEIFGIKHNYLGSVASTLATKVSMKAVMEDVNEKHLQPWSDICKTNNIENSPLTPYLDQELLYNNNLQMSNNKLKESGFDFKHPKVTIEACKSMLNDYVTLGLFPGAILS